MTDDKLIEVMAIGIYKAKGCSMPWAEAVGWLELEPYSTPALDVKRCRLHATAALSAIKAAGLAVVPVDEANKLLGIVADGASDQMYADPDDTEMLDAFNKLSAMIGKAGGE